MEIGALLLGVALGSIGAVLLLRWSIICRCRKRVARRGVADDNASGPRATNVEVDPDYVPCHAFTSKFEHAVKLAYDAVAESDSEWGEFEAADGAKYLQKDVEGRSMPIVRGSATIEAPPLGLLQMLLDPDCASAVDPQVKYQRVLATLDKQSCVLYTRLKDIFPFQGRDFYLARTHRQVAEGLLLVSTSIDRAEQPAVHARGVTRATCHFSGWLLRPGDGGSVTNATYVSSVDLNGSLPKATIQQVARGAPAVVARLKQLATGPGLPGGGDARRLHDPLLERGRASLGQLLLDVEQGGWEEVMAQKDVHIFRKSGAQDKFKGEGIIQAPPEEVGRVLTDPLLAAQFDENCREASVVATLNDTTKVVHFVYQASRCLLKVGRDFCVVHSRFVLDNGTYIFAAASVAHPGCPPRHDMVRAETSCCGWLVQPANGGRSSRVTHLTQLDLRGGVADHLHDYISMRVPLCIHQLRRFLEASVAKRPEPVPAAMEATDDVPAANEVTGPSHAFAAQAEEAMKKALAATNEAPSEWEQFDAKDGVQFFKKEVRGMPMPLIRGDALIDAAPADLLEVILDTEQARDLDPQVNHYKLVERLDKQTEVVYSEFNGMFTVAGRSFCILRTHRQVGSGVIVASCSVDHAAAAALQPKGHVRATCHFNGWLLQPTGDGSATRVVYATSVDLNGSIPKMITKKLMQDGPGVVMRLKHRVKRGPSSKACASKRKGSKRASGDETKCQKLLD